MNGKQRILTALERREADRVPLYIHGINEAPIIGIARRLTDGLPEPKQFHELTNPEKIKLVDALFLIHEHYGVDGVTTFEIGHDTPVDERHVRDDFGVVYVRSEHGLPVPKVHPIPDAEALKSYRPPVPNRAHLMLLDLARERFKGEKALFWLMRGTFVRSWRLTGMENLMLKMFGDPAFVHDVARLSLDYNLQQIDLLADAGLDVLVVEDDIAGGENPLLRPKQFEEFVNFYNRQLVQKAHQRGLKVVLHSDGNLWKLLDGLMDAGYDGINPLEPQADMDMARVKAYCGDRLCLLGNIDCVDLLPNGTPAQVEQAVIETIAAGGAGGGLIICSSNSLHPGVDPENCIAMFEAVKKHGEYGK